MSFTTPQLVPSGTPHRVLDVHGHPPASLQDFDGDSTFTVGEEMRYVVHGTGRLSGELVRFHEKDVDNNGKDIRVWQVRQEGSDFVAEHVGTF